MSLHWIPLTSEAEVADIITRSSARPQVIFKHSTRCSISVMVKNRLDNSTDIPEADFHYLDLLNFRSVSNFVAEKFQVHHESPQVLIIRGGECIFDESHNAITIDEIAEILQ